MTGLAIAGIAAGSVVVWWVAALATALSFAVVRRRYSGKTTTPFELAVVAVGWWLAWIYVVAVLVAIADNKIERREQARLDPDWAPALQAAKEELRGLPINEPARGGDARA